MEKLYTLNHEKWNSKPGERREIEKSVLLIGFKEYGFEVYDGEHSDGKAALSNPDLYEEWLDRDFRKFENLTSVQNTMNFSRANVNTILGYSGRAAANDPRARAAA